MFSLMMIRISYMISRSLYKIDEIIYDSIIQDLKDRGEIH